jgi:hypothetical protein
MPARDLCDAKNFNAGVTLESKAMKNGVFSGNLVLMDEGKKAARLTISISQGYDGLNYIGKLH